MLIQSVLQLFTVLCLNTAIHPVVRQNSSVPCKFFSVNKNSLLLSVVCFIAVLFIHCVVRTLAVLCFPSVKIYTCMHFSVYQIHGTSSRDRTDSWGVVWLDDQLMQINDNN